MVMAWGMAALWREQNRSHAALAKAQQARQREREALRFTFTASDQIAARALAKVAAPEPGPGPADREFCLHALNYYRQVSVHYCDDPEMRRIAAAADHRIGFIRMILKDEDGEPDYRRSIALYQEALARAPADPELRVELASAYSDLALLFRRTQQQPKAVVCLREVLTILQDLVNDFPDSRSYPLSLTMHQEQLMELFEAAGEVLKASKVRSQLRENYARELVRNPDDARSRNSLAWLLSSRPDTSLIDVTRAVELAREAVKLAPEVGSFWNTLGVASYRAGQWDSALSALDRSMRLRSGGDAYDWLFLAMACHRQGRYEDARRWHHQAVAWINADPLRQKDGELARFQAEAGRILEIDQAISTKRIPSLPVDSLTTQPLTH